MCMYLYTHIYIHIYIYIYALRSLRRERVPPWVGRGGRAAAQGDNAYYKYQDNVIYRIISL